METGISGGAGMEQAGCGETLSGSSHWGGGGRWMERERNVAGLGNKLPFADLGRMMALSSTGRLLGCVGHSIEWIRLPGTGSATKIQSQAESQSARIGSV